MTSEPATRASDGRTFSLLLVPLAAGCAVSLTLGIYGRLHRPSGIAVNVAGFSSPQTVKVWLASAAVLFALVQITSAGVMYGKIPGIKAPPWIGRLHRWSGRTAFLLTIPVVVQCLYALGFSTFSTRTLAHSLLGCFFYGAFTAKMLVLPKRDLPDWVLRTMGGLVFSALVGVWLTSSFWFFTTFGVKL
ncbi:MAG: DUF6529 family protein [Mycobacteriales bacterium]